MTYEIESLLERLPRLLSEVAVQLREHRSRVQVVTSDLVTANVGTVDAVLMAMNALVDADEEFDKGLAASEASLEHTASQLEMELVKLRTTLGVASPPSNAEPMAPLMERVSRVLARGRDPLTGLSNGAVFYDDVRRRLAEWKRNSAPLSLLFMRVDGRENAVSAFGVGAENVLVRAGAQFLKATSRDMDHVSRFDDDKFGMILPTANLENAVTVAERIRSTTERCTLTFNSGALNCSFSFGVAQAMYGYNASQLIQKGIAAMNTAANMGGNCTYVHNGERILPAAAVATACEA